MKRSLLPIILFGVLAISCELQTVPEIIQAPSQMTFCAQGECSTKVALDSTVINWLPGDCINIFDINENPCQGACFTTDLTKPSNRATFSGTCNTSEKGYFAVYPYGDYTTDDENGFLDIDEDGTPETIRLDWAGNRQLATPSSFKDDKAILVAKAEGDTLRFKNVFAYISVSITFPCESITIEGTNDEILACQSVDITWNDDIPQVQWHKKDKTGTKSVTIMKPDEDPILPGKYVFAVLPQTLSDGFTLSFINPNGGSTAYYKKSTSKSVTFQRGHILNLGSFSSEDFVSDGEWNGSGTATDPYMITSLEQLRKLGERVNGKNASKYKSKYYKLANDINCNHEWVYAIGNGDDHCFEGTFDGGGHRIYNYIASAAYKSSGLFGYIKNATIKNLICEVAGLKTREIYGEYVHAFSPLVGMSYSGGGKMPLIENVKVKTFIPGEEIVFSTWDCRISYGSLVGWAGGSIKIIDCEASVNVKLDSHASKRFYEDHNIGGIIGIVWPEDDDGYCIINRCRNTGNLKIEVPGPCAGGGIVGCDDDYCEDVTARITNCVNEGDVILNGSGWYANILSEAHAGGIIGDHDSDGDYSNGDPFIYNCLNKGKILSNGSESYSGGIIGYCYDNDTDIYCCVNTGEIIAWHDPHAGALCGSNSGSWHYCYWLAESNEADMVGDQKNGGFNQSNCSFKAAFLSTELNYAKSHIPANPSNYPYCEWYISGDGFPDLLMAP